MFCAKAKSGGLVDMADVQQFGDLSVLMSLSNVLETATVTQCATDPQ